MKKTEKIRKKYTALVTYQPLSDDALQERVAWRTGSRIEPRGEQNVLVRIYLDDAELYAYQVRPLPA